MIETSVQPVAGRPREARAEPPAAGEGLRLRDAGQRRKRTESWREAEAADKPERKVKAKLSHDDSARFASASARSKQSESSSGDEEGQAASPKSRFTGVHWNRRKRKWRVRIKAHGRDKHVGYFNDEEDAAWAYDRAVVMHNPALATDSAAVMKLNFPEAALRHGECIVQEEEDDEDEDDEEEENSVGAINMILAASQSPGRHDEAPGVDLETPPPHANGAESFAVVAAAPVTPVTQFPASPAANRALGFQGTPLAGVQWTVTDLPGPSSVFTPVAEGRVVSPVSPPGSDGSSNRKCCGNTAVSPSLLLSCRATPSQHPSQHSKVPEQLPSLLQGFSMLPNATQMDLIHTPKTTVAPPPALSADGGVKREEDAGEAVSVSPVGVDSRASPAINGEGDTMSQTCSSPSSLCHEGELEALKGLVELAGGGGGDQKNTGWHQQAPELSQLASVPPKRSTANAKKPPPQLPKRKSGTEGGRAAAQKGWLRDKGDVGGGAGGSRYEEGGVQLNASRRNQSFRGVTWDKMKKMWRVRVCLAGGGREHVGYFLNEREGALAYTRALSRIRQMQAEQQEKNEAEGVAADGQEEAPAPNDTAVEEQAHAENEPMSLAEVQG